MRKTACALFLIQLVIGCDGSGGADYLILRPILPAQGPGLTEATVQGQTVYYDPTTRIMDLRHFDPLTAKAEEHAGAYVVSIDTTPEGDRLLGTWTSANVNKQLGVFLDGRLISAPHIQTKITSMIVIEDELTKDRAEAIVARLRRGGAAE